MADNIRVFLGTVGGDETNKASGWCALQSRSEGVRRFRKRAVAKRSDQQNTKAIIDPAVGGHAFERVCVYPTAIGSAGAKDTKRDRPTVGRQERELCQGRTFVTQLLRAPISQPIDLWQVC